MFLYSVLNFYSVSDSFALWHNPLINKLVLQNSSHNCLCSLFGITLLCNVALGSLLLHILYKYTNGFHLLACPHDLMLQFLIVVLIVCAIVWQMNLNVTIMI